MISMTTPHDYLINALVLSCLFRIICSEKPREYKLASVIEACVHLDGLNEAFVNLIDFEALIFSIFNASNY